MCINFRIETFGSKFEIVCGIVKYKAPHFGYSNISSAKKQKNYKIKFLLLCAFCVLKKKTIKYFESLACSWCEQAPVIIPTQ